MPDAYDAQYIPVTKPLITPKELSAIINVSPGTLAVWRTKKTYELPYIKIGGKVMYMADGVNNWLKSRIHGNNIKG